MAKVGRPRKIKSVRQFEERAEAYFIAEPCRRVKARRGYNA